MGKGDGKRFRFSSRPAGHVGTQGKNTVNETVFATLVITCIVARLRAPTLATYRSRVLAANILEPLSHIINPYSILFQKKIIRFQKSRSLFLRPTKTLSSKVIWSSLYSIVIVRSSKGSFLSGTTSTLSTPGSSNSITRRVESFLFFLCLDFFVASILFNDRRLRSQKSPEALPRADPQTPQGGAPEIQAS